MYMYIIYITICIYTYIYIYIYIDWLIEGGHRPRWCCNYSPGRWLHPSLARVKRLWQGAMHGHILVYPVTAVRSEQRGACRAVTGRTYQRNGSGLRMPWSEVQNNRSYDRAQATWNAFHEYEVSCIWLSRFSTSAAHAASKSRLLYSTILKSNYQFMIHVLTHNTNALGFIGRSRGSQK